MCALTAGHLASLTESSADVCSRCRPASLIDGLVGAGLPAGVDDAVNPAHRQGAQQRRLRRLGFCLYARRDAALGAYMRLSHLVDACSSFDLTLRRILARRVGADHSWRAQRRPSSFCRAMPRSASGRPGDGDAQPISRRCREPAGGSSGAWGRDDGRRGVRP